MNRAGKTLKKSDEQIGSIISELKIAFLLPAVVSRGPVIFTHYLLMELKKRVKRAEIFYFKGNVEYDTGVKCTKISPCRPWDFSDFDIVHTTMGVPDIYGSIFCKKTAWVTSMHSYIDEDVRMSRSKARAGMILFLWEKALRKADNIIVSSNQMKTYYEGYISSSKNYKVIPYGIPEHEYEPVWQHDFEQIQKWKKRGYLVIGSAGLLIRRKGFHQIIRLLQKRKDCAAVIIGEGEERRNLEALAEKLGVSDRVFLPGYRESSYNYYQYMDIYAHVSYSEGFGLALLEAMSKRKPVICARLEIYQDYFLEKDVAYFDTGHIRSFVQAYDRVKNHLEQYSQASYQVYKEKFTLEKMAQEHIDFYLSVLKNRKSREQSQTSIRCRKRKKCFRGRI